MAGSRAVVGLGTPLPPRGGPGGSLGSLGGLGGVFSDPASPLFCDPSTLRRLSARLALGDPELHQAARVGDMDAVDAILARSPGAAMDLDFHHYVPLHHAASRGRTDVVARLLEAAPAAALARDVMGHTPVHAAIYQLDTDVVGIILDAVPEAALVPDDSGLLPLHLAAIVERGDGMTELIAAAVPEAAWVYDKGGRLPLHCANTERKARALLAVAPGAATTYRTTPMLCRYDVGLYGRLWEVVLDAAPAAAGAVDRGNWATPLHVAVRRMYAGLEYVEALLRLAPWTVAAVDDSGDTPLDVAIDNRRAPYYPEEVVAVLEAAAADVWFLDDDDRDEGNARRKGLEYARRRRMTPDQWEALGATDAELEDLLPAALARSRTEAAVVVKRMSPDARARVRGILACAHRLGYPPGLQEAWLLGAVVAEEKSTTPRRK